MSVKLILKEGELKYAVLPHEVHMRPVAAAEMLEDKRDYDTAAAGNSPSYLSQLETGKWTGTAQVLSAVATRLVVDLDDLV